MAHCNNPEVADYVRRLRNEKRKERNAERTANRSATRAAVASYYTEARA